jgi:predicted oxidoreductase
VVLLSGEDVTNEKVDRLRKDFDKHEEGQGQDMTRIWTAIDNLRNRPPVWATVTIAILAGACGWLGRGAS